MTQISLDKNVFNKKDFEKLVNTRFTQLINNEVNVEDTFTLDDFFQLYDEIFDQIPREGDIDSHRYILNREAEYLGVPINEQIDVQALLDEITSLRSELLDANKTLLELNSK